MDELFLPQETRNATGSRARLQQAFPVLPHMAPAFATGEPGDSRRFQGLRGGGVLALSTGTLRIGLGV
jgi:hypothetical protein